MNMATLPCEGPVKVVKHRLSLHEVRRVQRPTPTRFHRWDHVVKHLVVDDVRNEVSRHPRPIKRWVHADEALRWRVTS